MKKIISSFLSLQFIFLISCNESPKVYDKYSEPIIIKNEFSDSPILFSQIIDSITYTALETDSNCLIGEIKKIIPFKNRYYVHDRKTKSILWFSNDGIYIDKIKNIGKGPGEYLKISEFFICNDNIHIYDANIRKIILYSMEGKFIKDIKTGRDLIRDIIPISDGGYLCMNEFDDSENTRTGVWKIDSNGKFQSQQLEFEKYLNILSYWSPLYKYDNEVRFLSQLDNSIYSFKNDSLAKLYSYRFEDLLSVEDMKKGEVIYKELDIENYSVLETKEWIISNWPDPNYKKPAKVIFHSKTNNDITICRGHANDISGITGSLVKTEFMKNKLLCVLNCDDIITNKDLILKYNDKFQFENIKSGNNPMIQTLHFK